MLSNKTIVVGVCGGIAAYKVVDAVSKLKKLNADVHVIMTKNAQEFVTPLTFQSISHNPVTVDMFEAPEQWNIHHISLAQRADLLLVAPATANIIGKIANGICDDMLSTTITATKAKVLFVPAMNFNMYENPVVQENIAKLKRLGYSFMEPGVGSMAEAGLSGKGRLPEPLEIVEEVKNMFELNFLSESIDENEQGVIEVDIKTISKEVKNKDRDLDGVNILITAGPTREAIDPVRYISNHSSGKMGYAIAEVARNRGAKVVLISGPVNLKKPFGIELHEITTAADMYKKAVEFYEDADIVIMAAAPADYKCAEISDKKLKKTEEDMELKLEKNVDIAFELGKIKKEKLHIGFCAETNDLLENAKKKIVKKNFDMIVANDVTQEGAGFGTDTNIVKLVYEDGKIIDFPIMLKTDLAEKLLDEVKTLITFL